MKITRQRRGEGNWSPLAELGRLRGELNRIFDSRNWPAGPFAGRNWTPSVDVLEDQDRITVQAELPGFKKEDIEVSIHGDHLSISGERKHEEESTSGQAYRAERYYGRFQRDVMLPEEVDPDRASASYKDGVLCIYLPKTEQSKRKRIEVQAA